MGGRWVARVRGDESIGVGFQSCMHQMEFNHVGRHNKISELRGREGSTGVPFPPPNTLDFYHLLLFCNDLKIRCLADCLAKCLASLVFKTGSVPLDFHFTVGTMPWRRCHWRFMVATFRSLRMPGMRCPRLCSAGGVGRVRFLCHHGSRPSRSCGTVVGRPRRDTTCCCYCETSFGVLTHQRVRATEAASRWW